MILNKIPKGATYYSDDNRFFKNRGSTIIELLVDNRTNDEKMTDDILQYVLKFTCGDKSYREDIKPLIDAIKSGKIHNLGLKDKS